MDSTKEINTLYLHFAHRGEARSFLKEFPFKALEENCYELNLEKDNLKIILFIGGEGIEENLVQTTYYLTKYPSSKKANLINLGICGALKNNPFHPKLGDMAQIRTCFAEGFKKPTEFKSFNTSREISFDKNLIPSLDILSVRDRVLDEKQANHLSHFAPLIDRELWAVGRVCHQLAIPFQSFKLISDYADGAICERVKEQSEEWSDSLLRFFKDHILPSYGNSLEESNSQSVLWPLLGEMLKQNNFHVTISQERTLKQYSRILELKGFDLEFIASNKDFEEICNDPSLRQKDRTKKLIELISKRLNPLQTQLDERLQRHFLDFKRANAQIRFDRDFEKTLFHLSATINSAKELDALCTALQNLSFEEFKAILENGHV